MAPASGSSTNERGARQRPAQRMALEVEAQQASEQPGVTDTSYADLKRILTALIFLVVACYGLHEAKFVQNLIYSKQVNSLALLFSVLSSSIVVLLWGYLDLYVGTIQGQKVHYPDVRRITHVILLCLLCTGIGLNVALWPVYRAATPVLVLMLTYGVCFQLIVLFPSYVYNPLFFAGYAAFVYLWTR